MSYTVTGVTVETNGLTKEQVEQMKIFSGKNAGICYMGDSYFDSSVSDPAKALPRFVSTAKNAHHSIADHVRIEVLMKGISKMLAIVLNSLQDYATSEKSGRYTVMTGNSERERELYDKWSVLLRNRILELQPSLDDVELMKLCAKKGHSDIIIRNGELANDNMADLYEEHQRILHECKTAKSLPSVKKAQENARYMLSVFTRSTIMGYSTSLRQWNYIYDWCQKYLSQFMPRYDNNYIDAMSGGNSRVTIVYKGTDEPVTYFEEQLYYDMLALSNFIYENLYVEELRDTKNRSFDFLVGLSGEKDCPMIGYDLSPFEPDSYYGTFDYRDNSFSKDDIIDTVYQVSYPASFVHIAQAERHRTLKYFMFFNPNSKYVDWFIPKFIEGTKLAKEWVEDLESIKDIVPQATQVAIVETGHISNFLLKCEERLCSKAQWEIMNQTRKTAQRFIDAVGTKSKVFDNYATKLISQSTGVTTKCQMMGRCYESCGVPAENILNRHI